MQRSTTCARRMVLAASLSIVLGLVACGGGGGSGGEIAGPEVPDTPSLPPPPPAPLVFSGLQDFASASGVLGQPGFITSASGAPSATRLSEPTGLAVSESGSVYVADTVNRRVLVFKAFPGNLGQPPTSLWASGIWTVMTTSRRTTSTNRCRSRSLTEWSRWRTAQPIVL